MAYGQNPYGPPPQQQHGGYGPPPGGQPPGPPQQPPGPPQQGAPAKKKSPLLFVGIGVGALVLLGAIGGVGIWLYGKSKRGNLPVDAKLLPTDTKTVGTYIIESTREPDERVQAMYLASELGTLCGNSSFFFDPARKIELLPTSGPKAAKELFFDKKALDEMRAHLECGFLLSTNLKEPKESYVFFDSPDEDKKKFRGVTVMSLTIKSLPADQGYTPFSFSSISGFCKTAGLGGTPLGGDAGAPSGGTGASTCTDDMRGAFAYKDTWFFGDKASLDEMAKSINNPKDELGTNVSALKDAAGQTFGLPSLRLQAQPKTSKEFFKMACEWGALQSAMSMSDFGEACFPTKGEERVIEEIDAKLKAAAWESDADIAKAGAFIGNIVLVTRDNDAAKDTERAVNELVRDWKAHIETNSAKAIKETKEKASSSRQKKFAAVVDSFFSALSKLKVTREGRSVRISFNEKLTPEDKQSLIDADKNTVEKRQATTDILEAVRLKKAIPQASLAKLVGAKWAAYLTGPPPPSVTSGSGPMVTLTNTECESVKARLQSFNVSQLPTGDSKVMDAYFKQKYVTCSSSPPSVPDGQRACLATFVTADDYAKCTGGGGVDPREPPSDTFGKP